MHTMRGVRGCVAVGVVACLAVAALLHTAPLSVSAASPSQSRSQSRSPCEAATRALRATERAELCQNAGGNTGPAECWGAMRAVSSLSRSLKIELCRGAKAATPAACFQASPTRLGAELRVALCKVRACVRVCVTVCVRACVCV